MIFSFTFFFNSRLVIDIGVAMDTQDDFSLDFSYSFLHGIDPNHLPLTIEIPERAMSLMGNMERQYWEIKAKYFNIVIFFKKGKFYELYDYDAVIAKKEFGLKMVFDTTNRGKMRLAGIPEQSFSEWARLFVFRGYKIGRVEQMKEEVSDGGKNKVVPRELVEIITPGTVTDPMMISDYKELFLVSLVPLPTGRIDAFAVDLSRNVAYQCPCPDYIESTVSSNDEKNICFVSNLLHLLNPREVLVPEYSEKNEGWSSFPSTCRFIESERYQLNYFPCMDNSHVKKGFESAENLLQEYLRYLKLDACSIFNNVSIFSSHLCCSQPGTGCSDSLSTVLFERKNDHGLFIDSQSSCALELLTNSRDGTEKGSLLEFANLCITNGGKRLFASWILRPSTSVRVIQARQQGVRFLSDVLKNCEPILNTRRGRESKDSLCNFDSCFSGPSFDLERQLSRMIEIKNDNLNVAYVDPQLQLSKKLRLILSCIDSISTAVKWAQDFASVFSSAENFPSILKELIVDVSNCERSLMEINQLFDRKETEEKGILVPRGEAASTNKIIETRLLLVKEKLEFQKKKVAAEIFNVEINFCDLGKDLFLVEVPSASAPKVPPHGFVERARSSRSVKYVFLEIQPLIVEYKKATEEAGDALARNLRDVAARICEHSTLIYSLFQGISYFDCLFSLAKLHIQNSNTSFPEILEEGGSSPESFINGKGMTHPLLGSSAIPSDICLDNKTGKILLLTGPNMGGKSTLMRTVGTNVILAQMGGPVFASSLKFFPLQRIFTRIGARDATQKGQSTLFVELTEAANILRHATNRCLSLIDELGRGTSTHDGLAIASATLDFLEQSSSAPLTIFSTHYHTLAIEKKNTSSRNKVQLGYMNFRINSTQESEIRSNSYHQPSLTFLYKLTSGICANSFGIEVAAMAAIPQHVLTIAHEQSNRFLQRSTIQSDLEALRTLR